MEVPVPAASMRWLALVSAAAHAFTNSTTLAPALTPAYTDPSPDLGLVLGLCLGVPGGFIIMCLLLTAFCRWMDERPTRRPSSSGTADIPVKVVVSVPPDTLAG